MRMAIVLVGALALGLGPRAARAGYCGEEYALETVQDVERYAKRGGKVPETDELCIEEAWVVPRLKARLLKACEAILAREPGFGACLEWAATAGIKSHGGVDVFAALAAARSLDPFGDGRLAVALYVSLGDARAAAPVLAAWKAARADARWSKKKFAHVLAVYQNAAVALFHAVGGADERAFLVEQVALTKGPGLKKRMKQAIAAIDRRAARP